MTISNSVQIALHGIAKIYSGELVEEAKMYLVEEENNFNLQNRKDKPTSYGAIKPRHLREARRRMIQRSKIDYNILHL